VPVKTAQDTVLRRRVARSFDMTSRTRLWVLAVSTPVIAFALVGGYLGRVMAKDETYQHLRIFQDVVSLVVDNYVEPVDVKQAMRGAMRGLADGLDPDSAYLTPELARSYETNAPMGAADPGLDIARQYYLRIISVRPNSPAAKAGIRNGDYIRAIDGKPTREMAAYEGLRLLHGAEGSRVKLLIIRGNAADPHEVTVAREKPAGPELTTRMADSATGYIHIIDFRSDSASRLKQAVDALAKTGATRYVIDIRGASRGDLDDGVAAAKLFVKNATLVVKQSKQTKEPVVSQASDGAVTARLVLLVDQGTAGPGETFAAALDANDRAELVGEHTPGRAARQRLVKLPDGSGLLLTTQRYLTAKNVDIHEKGLTPDVGVDEPDVDFGAEPPPGDKTLEKGLQELTQSTAKRPAA
jgi:carboxyl-terminal processing protease